MHKRFVVVDRPTGKRLYRGSYHQCTKFIERHPSVRSWLGIRPVKASK